jgi:hypothetical protein
MTTLTPTEVIGLWITQGGSIGTAPMALARAYSESSLGDTETSSNPDGGTNVGLYQLDTRGVGSGYTVAQLSNPVTNTRITVDATKGGQDWSDWADNYQEFLTQAAHDVSVFTGAAKGNVSAYAKSATSNLGGASGDTTSSTATNSGQSSASLTSIVSSVSSAVDDFNTISTVFSYLSSPSHWFRIGALFFGVVLLGVAIFTLFKQPSSGGGSLPIPVPV